MKAHVAIIMMRTWLDTEYLLEIVNLHDYVPKTIGLYLLDYEVRSHYVLSDESWYTSDEFVKKEILDQIVAETTWEEHVSVYDDFFNKLPEFSKLINDKSIYDKWRLEIFHIMILVKINFTNYHLRLDRALRRFFSMFFFFSDWYCLFWRLVVVSLFLIMVTRSIELPVHAISILISL